MSTGAPRSNTRKGVVCRGRPAHTTVGTIEEVVSEAPGDHGGPAFRIWTYFCPVHHVPVVELDVHVGLLIDQVVSASCGEPARSSSQKSQLSSWPPEPTVLNGAGRKRGREKETESVQGGGISLNGNSSVSSYF